MSVEEIEKQIQEIASRVVMERIGAELAEVILANPEFRRMKTRAVKIRAKIILDDMLNTKESERTRRKPGRVQPLHQPQPRRRTDDRTPDQ